MIEATGKLTHLENINSIGNVEPAKFYTLQKCYIDKKDMGMYYHEFVTEARYKSPSNTVIRINIVIPILAEISDTVNKACNAWIGIMYNKPFWGVLKGKELEDERKAFVEESQKDFESRNIQELIYLDRVGKNYQMDEFREAIKRSKKTSLSAANIFTAVNAPFESRYTYDLKWFLVIFCIGCGAWFGLILIPPFDEHKLQQFKAKHDHSE